MLRHGLVRLDVLYKVLGKASLIQWHLTKTRRKSKEVRDRFFPGESRSSGSSPDLRANLHLVEVKGESGR